MDKKYNAKFQKGKFKAKRIMNARKGVPKLDAPATEIAVGTIIEFEGWVENGELFNGITKWFFDKSENFYWSGNCEEIIEAIDKNIQILQPNYPIFIKGVSNLYNSANTIEVREILKKSFNINGGKNKWDLQCTEYVCYIIKKEKNITIDWGVITSGRDGGKWPEIFTKLKKYKVLDYPVSGCAMCFFGGLEKTSAKNTGHVAYVEKVYDDGTIDISEANWPGQGKYNLRKLSKLHWQNICKAKFVDFTV